MVRIGDFINHCWLHTGRSWIDMVKFWKDRKIMSTYFRHHKSPVNILPPRARRLSISDTDSQKQHVIPSPQSALLNLPAEIRCLVWQHVCGGHHIALYRDGNQIIHCLVDDTNSREPEYNDPVNVELIEYELIKRRKLSRKLVRKKSRPNTLNALSLLQSCRSIYSECINLLYSQNTFIFLQNDTLPDFSKTILPQRFHCIRSIHIHFQFRELGPWSSRSGFNEESLQLITNQLWPSRFPNLERLSVFIQGPMWLGITYQAVLAHLRIIGEIRTNLKSFVVRLPKQMSDPLFGSHWGVDIDDMVEDPDLPFQVVRPELAIGRLEDQDVGLDIGWRHGELFVPRDERDASLGFEVRRYTVWTPMPLGLSWPCQQSKW